MVQVDESAVMDCPKQLRLLEEASCAKLEVSLDGRCSLRCLPHSLPLSTGAPMLVDSVAGVHVVVSVARPMLLHQRPLRHRDHHVSVVRRSFASSPLFASTRAPVVADRVHHASIDHYQMMQLVVKEMHHQQSACRP